MKVSITARHFDLSPELKAFVDDELQKLNRFFDNIVSVVSDKGNGQHAKTKKPVIHIKGSALQVKDIVIYMNSTGFPPVRWKRRICCFSSW